MRPILPPLFMGMVDEYRTLGKPSIDVPQRNPKELSENRPLMWLGGKHKNPREHVCMEENILIRSDCMFMTLEGLEKVPKTCEHTAWLLVNPEIPHRLIFVWQSLLHYRSDVLLELGHHGCGEGRLRQSEDTCQALLHGKLLYGWKRCTPCGNKELCIWISILHVLKWWYP